jgi:hypothetical protein
MGAGFMQISGLNQDLRFNYTHEMEQLLILEEAYQVGWKALVRDEGC